MSSEEWEMENTRMQKNAMRLRVFWFQRLAGAMEWGDEFPFHFLYEIWLIRKLLCFDWPSSLSQRHCLIAVHRVR